MRHFIGIAGVCVMPVASSLPMTASTPRIRIEGLDTLRALAIVFVVLHHYVLFVSDAPTFGWAGNIGWVGVDLFFALSGYLIGNQIFSALRGDAGLSLKRFYARRFLRTLPNFYAMLALYYLWPWFRQDAALPDLWRFLSFTLNIGLEPGTLFSHAWSLCIEEQFYVALPAVAMVIAAVRGSLRWAWAAVVLTLALGLVARAWLWQAVVDDASSPQWAYFKYIYYASFCRLDELVAGVALALLKNYHPRTWRRLTAHGNALFVAGLAICALTFGWFLAGRYEFAVTVFGFPLLAAGFSLLIVAALSEGSVLSATRVPGAGKIALWSYAIYLTHKQVSVLGAQALSERGYGPDSALVIGALMVVSVLSGWVLFRCVETPFMWLRERYVPLKAPLKAPLKTSIKPR